MTETKRYFGVDDHVNGGGVDYTIVARDQAHAKQLLIEAGVEFCDENGMSHPVNDPRVQDVHWWEIEPARAAKIQCHHDDNPKSPTTPLTECAIGDWFCTE